MGLFNSRSLKWQIILLTGFLVTLVFILLIAYTSINFNQQLKQSIYHDLATKNEGYVNTILSTFEGKADKILAIRDDLELYDNVAQMWVYLAAHAGEKIFDDHENADIYVESFNKKLDYFKSNGYLSGKNLSPELEKMLANIKTKKNTFGDGLKFFYIGVNFNKENKDAGLYDQYQDSSLWVPDLRVDKPYNPLIRPWYIAGQEASRDEVVFTEPYAERRTKEALSSGATLIEINGIRGTLAGAISIKPIMDKILKGFQENAEITIFSEGAKQSTTFINDKPKYVYSSRDSRLGEEFYAYDDGRIIHEPSNNDIKALYDKTLEFKSGVLEWVINGDQRLVSYNTVPKVGWKIFISVSKSKLMYESAAMMKKVVLLSIIGLLILLVLIYWVVGKTFKPIDDIGKELNNIAETGDLTIRTTVKGSDEIAKVATAINAMLDNTVKPIHELSKKSNLIAKGDFNVDMDIPAKGDVAELVSSFNKMTSQLIEFEAISRDASPLTGLSGGVSIDRNVQHRINNNTPFAFCLFDLDNFKPFNDLYGYSRGNLVIKRVANIIQETVELYGEEEDFIGHIGGDDFVLIADPFRYEEICLEIMKHFDEIVHEFYDNADRAAGFITSTNRQGVVTQYPLMTISISAVDSEKTELTDHVRVGEVVAELKHFVKQQEGSNFMIDRRGKLRDNNFNKYTL